jgi:hypothetical protein
MRLFAALEAQVCWFRSVFGFDVFNRADACCEGETYNLRKLLQVPINCIDCCRRRETACFGSRPEQFLNLARS